MAPLAALPLAFFLLATACDRAPTARIVAPDGAPLATVKLELADTPHKREFGLMYRTHLDADAGMLFLFLKPAHLSFWMKNTEIPLDMIFIGSDRSVVGVIADARPYSETPLGVPGAVSQFVLEVNGGFCQRHRVKVGDRLEFSGFAPVAAD